MKKELKKSLKKTMGFEEAEAQALGKETSKESKAKLKFMGYYYKPESIEQLNQLELKLKRKKSSIMQEALEDIISKYSK